MADEKIFAAGMIYRAPHAKAPSFVLAEISIKTEEFVPFLEAHTKPDGWVNLQVKESKGGKLYVELNHYTRDADATRRPSRGSEEGESPLADYPQDDIKPEDSPF